MKRALMVGFVFTLVLALGLVGRSSYASADPGDINVWVPIDTVVDDLKCTGESAIHITGMIHQVIRTSTTASGGTHFDESENTADLKGIGLFRIPPLSYVVNDTLHDSLNFDGPEFDTTLYDPYRT